MDWWRLDDGNYVNPDMCTSVYATNAGSYWQLNVDVNGVEHKLSGSWTTVGDAQEAARQLTSGINPGDFNS